MHKIIKITFLYILLVFISNAALSENISPSEAVILSKSNKIMIIDVRNKSEWKETGIIPGANLVQMLNPIFKIRKDFVKKIIEVLGPDKTISAPNAPDAIIRSTVVWPAFRKYQPRSRALANLSATICALRSGSWISCTSI